MLRRIWPPFVLVCAYMLLLLGFAGTTLIRTSRAISAKIATTETAYRQIDDSLETVRLDILEVAVLIRDSLLDQNPGALPVIQNYEREIQTQVKLLSEDPTIRDAADLRTLETDILRYFETVYKVSDVNSPVSLRNEFRGALQKRVGAIRIAADLSKMNDLHYDTQQKAIRASMASLRSEILETIVIALMLSTAAAGTALYWVWEIEKRNQIAHELTADARQQLENLSRQLVTAQEQERKALSRELHDEIGQSLTALKLELAKSEKIARAEGSSAVDHLKTVRELADQTLSAARNISLGLRPPMLDDLGLAAALNWYTGEFSRRSDIAVDLQVDGNVGRLSEVHRTCLFRIVQEALTNCARHSHAGKVSVRIDTNEDSLALSIADDGAGFQAESATRRGLGLLSMRERSIELGGSFRIVSAPGQGTTIRVTIPCSAGAALT